VHQAGFRGLRPGFPESSPSQLLSIRPTIAHLLEGDHGSLANPSGTWQLQDFQLLQPGYSIRSSRCGFDLAVNVKDLTILPNIKRPALRNGPTFMHYTVRLGDFLSRVAEDGIIDTKRFSESFVVFRTICAGGKVGDIGVLERFAILTE
jgi:hypothetical protein